MGKRIVEVPVFASLSFMVFIGPGWIRVAAEAIATDEELAFWMEAALACNRRLARRA